MEFRQLKATNKLALLIGATLLLQLAVLATGSLVKLTLPANRVDMPGAGKLTLRHQTPSEFQILPEGIVEEAEDLRSEMPEEAAPERAESKVVVHHVKPGDTLSKIWGSYGAPVSGGLLAAQALKTIGVSLNAIRNGDNLDLQISAEGDITGLKKKLTDGKVMLLDGNSSKGYKATLVKPELVKKERIVSGTITRSFADSAQKVNLPRNVVDALVDLFSSRVEFRKDLQPGDAFAVVFDESTTPDGQFISAGPIKAASIEKAGQSLFAIRHEGKSGKALYYDNKGQALGDTFLRYPLQFSFISSMFSYGRFHPVLKKVLPHNGIDFAAPSGTPVRTVGDGVVTFAGYSLSGGNTVKIKHGDRYSTVYMHLSRFSPGLRQGEKVARGEVIGAVGSTGISTGPHLHFGFFDRDRYVNPLTKDLPTNGYMAEPIPQSYLQAKVMQLKTSQESVKMAALPKQSKES